MGLRIEDPEFEAAARALVEAVRSDAEDAEARAVKLAQIAIALVEPLERLARASLAGGPFAITRALRLAERVVLATCRPLKSFVLESDHGEDAIVKVESN